MSLASEKQLSEEQSRSVAAVIREELARRRAEFDKQKEIARGNRAA